MVEEKKKLQRESGCETEIAWEILEERDIVCCRDCVRRDSTWRRDCMRETKLGGEIVWERQSLEERLCERDRPWRRDCVRETELRGEIVWERQSLVERLCERERDRGWRRECVTEISLLCEQGESRCDKVCVCVCERERERGPSIYPKIFCYVCIRCSDLNLTRTPIHRQNLTQF